MTSKALTVIERAALALNSQENKAKLQELVAQSASIVEIKNTAARDQCHSAAMALRTRRTDIRKTGKDARDDATKFSKAVIAEEDSLVAIIEPEEQRLLVLRDAWDEARAAEKRAKEEAEAKRVAKIRDAIEDFRRAPGGCPATSSAAIDEHADDLARALIELDFYMEFTGEAEAARDVAVNALREMANKARAREADEARIKAEMLELARLRAEHEERERKAAAERAEQERKAREALEAEEARLRAERSEEEAKLRAQREAEEAKLRAEREAHEAQMRAQREEMARQQAELAIARQRQAQEEADKRRAEEEARAKELRELAEAQEKAEREKRERERAENMAARNDPAPTGGEWAARGTEVITTVKLPGCIGTGHNEEDYYGSGALIAESIMRPADARLIAAAPALLDVLSRMVEQITDERNAEHTLGAFSLGARIAEAREAIAAATLEAVPA